jgi:putative sporulation protein YyaC
LKNWPADDLTEVRVNIKDTEASTILSNYLAQYINDKSVLICIGTDRCIGDCLGPMVGTLLQKNGYPYPVYGTIDHPVHAVNLPDTIYKVRFEHPSSLAIAIDACLGSTSAIGDIILRKGAIFPGKGVGKKLPSVGDISLVGIVNHSQSNDFLAIHNIRLSFVMQMSEIITKAILMSV